MFREVNVYNDKTGEFVKRPAETMSEVLGGSGYGAQDKLHDMEQAANAAYTAKHFMDVAVELYDTRMNAWLMGDAESEEDRQMVASETDLQSLVEYAQRKANKAVELGQEVALTHNEKIIIEAYKAQVELERAIEECRDEYFADTPELQAAINVTEERINAAQSREDRAKWIAMSNKLVRYQESFKYDDKLSRDEFNPSISNTSYLLQMAKNDVQSDGAVTIGDVSRDTQMMQEKSEMLRFLTSLPEQTADIKRPAGAESENQGHTGLTPEQIAAAKKQLEGMKTKGARGEEELSKNTIELSDDWIERDSQVKAWVEENGTELTPDAVNVARQYVIKSVEAMIRQMQKGRLKNPDLEGARYNNNLTGVFGSFISMEPTTGIHEILAKAYFKSHPEKTQLSPVDYAKIAIPDIANALKFNVKDIANFESVFA